MVDRDFHDIGVAKFTIKSFVVKNGLHNAKSNTVLAAWNPPGEWGRCVLSLLNCFFALRIIMLCK